MSDILRSMGWAIEYTDQFAAWWDTLSEDQQDAISAAVDELQEEGPVLGRPLADTLRGSRHPNMKELRPPGGSLRVLFAYDPRRTAILLLGGDKTGRWAAWYREASPEADRLYDDYLEELRREGALP